MVIDRLFAEGALRIAFDRAYADPDGQDRVLATALERHRGRVWLGASPPADNGLQQHAGLLPTPVLRRSTNIASMMGQVGPFGLSVQFPTNTTIEGEPTPSISAVLADYQGDGGWYRPDFAFDPSSIATVSYADVLASYKPGRFAGKTVVIAATHLESSDFLDLPLGGKVPGAYFHVMGAHTLKGGMPIDLGWMPAIFFAGVVLILQARRCRPSRLLTLICLAALPVAATALDVVHVNIDVFPALIALTIGLVRLNLLAGRLYNRETNLLTREALEEKRGEGATDIYALKINNLGDFSLEDAPQDLGRFIGRVIALLQDAPQSGAAAQQIAFEKDTLIWQAAKLPRTDLEENAQGLLALLRSGHPIAGGLRIEATLGIDTNKTLAFRARVDHALQAAETGSRRSLRCIVADASWLGQRERRIELLSELDKAIAEKTIGIGYQPKVDLMTGWITGAEALLRWEHPDLGYMDPEEVIAVAEEHDRIDDLTFCIIDRVLGETAELVREKPLLKVAINLSAKTLANVMVLYHVTILRNRHKFPGKNLVFEVTETAPLAGLDIIGTMRGLRSDGITFSIDDFGTGHSNLTSLREVPSAELKIDRQFVKGLASAADSAAVVKNTIDLGHSLGKIVVAEGVEDDLTAERLRHMGCDLAQGFLYSPAVPRAQLLEILAKDRMAA